MYSMALKYHTEDSSSNGYDPIWKHIWSLHIHPKAQIFLWKVMWDILPYGSNLCKKGIDNVGQCTRCGLLESNTHILRECKWSKEVWEQLRTSIDLPRHDVSMREWFGMMINNRTKSEVELWSVIAWQIGCARNELIFEKVYTSPELFFKKAIDLLQEYKLPTAGTYKVRVCKNKVRWVPPDQNLIKINVDAAVNVNDDKVGLGIVARNASGEVLLATSKPMWHFVSVERAELEAFQWAMELIKDQKWRRVLVEGDA